MAVAAGGLRFRGSSERVRRVQRRHLAWFTGAASVLDVGCGRGEFLDLLREAGMAGYGIDPSAEAVDGCRRRGHEVERAGALTFLAETERRFDGAYCSHVVEHLPPTEVRAFLTGLRRVVRPGGRIVIVTPNPSSLYVLTELFWLDPTHVRPYPLGLLVDLLEGLDLRILAAGEDEATRPRVRGAGLLRVLLRAFVPSPVVRGWLLGADDNLVVAEVPGKG